MIDVIVLAPSGRLVAGAVPALVAEGAAVVVVAVDPVGSTGHRTIAVGRPGRVTRGLERAMLGTAAGRALRRLTPLDPGSWFWRATRRTDEARRAIGSARVVVAVERDAMYAAWRWARRRGEGAAVVYGVPAARAALRALHASVAEDGATL